MIEQNAVSQRRSRSPKRSLMQGQHHQPLNSNAANASASATLHHGNQGGVEFRAPLMIEQARHVNPKTPCQIVTFRSRAFSSFFPFFFSITFQKLSFVSKCVVLWGSFNQSVLTETKGPWIDMSVWQRLRN